MENWRISVIIFNLKKVISPGSTSLGESIENAVNNVIQAKTKSEDFTIWNKKHVNRKYADLHDMLMSQEPFKDNQERIAELKAQIKVQLNAQLQLNPTSNPDPPNIIIGGAGLVGLFLANALIKNGHPPEKIQKKIQIIEKREKEDATTRPNNVQLRDDYRKEDPFILLKTLDRLLARDTLNDILLASQNFGKSILQTPQGTEANKIFEELKKDNDQDIPFDRILLSVGYLQEQLMEKIPSTCFKFGLGLSDEPSDDPNSLVFDCTGPDTTKKAITAGEPIETEHSWFLHESPQKKETKYTDSGFLSTRNLHWDEGSEQCMQKREHNKTFALNLLKRSITNKQKSTPESIQNLAAKIKAIESGESTSITYSLCHKEIGSEDFNEKLSSLSPILDYPLTTQPNFHPQSPSTGGTATLLGDALGKPHPYAAHGMLGGFKSIEKALDYISLMSTDSTPKQKHLIKSILLEELNGVGMYQMATLLMMQNLPK